jgi:hypothetical protein
MTVKLKCDREARARDCSGKPTGLLFEQAEDLERKARSFRALDPAGGAQIIKRFCIT